ncbi:hypothetical protein [Mesorhizobium sp.]|uniref:hypothetical protein n=1 Tax=Mesorhizobium sp. TaxID=1871066 RepID=UPI000FE6875C|nr:hypothetical protein [Mesorhizobium sp.]RWO61113.1 MAG: hypothetical protein EOS14_07280 [Mesorhizobium sp.]
MTDIERKILEYERQYRSVDEERPEPFDVEEAFDRFVQKLGGKKISDTIDNKSNMPKNADYLFSDANVIAELKTVDGLYSGQESYKLLRQLFIDAGTLEQFFPYIIGRTELPDEVGNRIRKRVRRGFEGRARKARSQIKESISEFGNMNTYGVILFALNQPPLFGQTFMLSTLAKMMDDIFSKDNYIDGIVYLNPNVPTRPVSDGMEYSGWFPLYMSEEPDHALSEFVNKLGSGWLNFVANEQGTNNPILTLEDSTGLPFILGRGL